MADLQSTIGVFFEIKHLVKYDKKLKTLLERLNADPYASLAFLIIPEINFRRLNDLKPGEERINYVSSEPFINSIVYTFCTVHDPETKTIMLGECNPEYILPFIDAVNLYFEGDFSIVSEYSEQLLDSGFSNPFVCFKNKICISRPTGFIPSNLENKKVVKHDLKYIKSQQQSSHCSVFLEIDPESAEYLKFLTRASVVFDKTGRYQREVFGKLKVKTNRIDETGEVVYTLAIDKSSIVHGEAEKISGVSPYLYTFHSHPYEAYVNHKAMFGFPSSSDYSAMYILHKYRAILHFVAALEGLYVISIVPDSEILSKPEKEVLKFIKENYNISKKKIQNIDDYVKNVNKHGLFKLELIPWDRCGVKIKVVFGKTDEGNCIIR